MAANDTTRTGPVDMENQDDVGKGQGSWDPRGARESRSTEVGCLELRSLGGGDQVLGSSKVGCLRSRAQEVKSLGAWRSGPRELESRGPKESSSEARKLGCVELGS